MASVPNLSRIWNRVSRKHKNTMSDNPNNLIVFVYTLYTFTNDTFFCFSLSCLVTPFTPAGKTTRLPLMPCSFPHFPVFVLWCGGSVYVGFGCRRAEQTDPACWTAFSVLACSAFVPLPKALAAWSRNPVTASLHVLGLTRHVTFRLVGGKRK